MRYVYTVSTCNCKTERDPVYAYCLTEREALLTLAKVTKIFPEDKWTMHKHEVDEYPKEESVKWVTTFRVDIEKDFGISKAQMEGSIKPVLQEDLVEIVDFHSSNVEIERSYFVIKIETPSSEAWRIMGKALKHEWIAKAIERVSGIKVKSETEVKAFDENLVVGGITRINREEKED